MRKIVVAGAGGFIGGHLVKELIKKGSRRKKGTNRFNK
jgi:uncharacterized protein YbjT (DUF2867 family)